MSATPETDAAEQSVEIVHQDSHTESWVSVDFARTLERQRNEAREQSRLGWARHAEKDAAYGAALKQRDEAAAQVLSLLRLVADIRAAVGDPTGKLMQDELVEHCRQLFRERAELLAALETTLEHVPITLQGKARAAIAAVKGTK